MPGGVKFSPEVARRVTDAVRDVEAQRPSASGRRPRQNTPVRAGIHFGVRVTKDGGTNGTASTEASWTYTVTTLGEDPKTLGTAVVLSHPRPKGEMDFGTTYGEAFYDGDTLILWNAGEREPTEEGCVS